MIGLETWIREQAGPLMEGIRNRKGTPVCFPAGDRLWGVMMKEGKVLSSRSVPLKEGEDSLGLAFQALAREGFRGKHVTFLLNSSGIRLANKRYPAMTEEEVEETMYWEADRVFRTTDPLSLGYQVMGKNETGWDIHVEAVKKEELRPFEQAAREADMRITRIIPVTAVPLLEKPHFVLYGRKRSAILLFHAGGRIRSRLIKPGDEGKGTLFMETLLEEVPLLQVSCFFLPLEDCGKTEEEDWKAWLRKELPHGGSVRLPEDRNSGKRVLMEPEDFPVELTPFQEYLPALAHLEESMLSLPPALERKPLFTEENRTLRLAEGALCAGALFALFMGGLLVSDSRELAQARQQELLLRPAKEALIAQRENNRRESEAKALLQELEAKDSRWERKLVALGEIVPQGIVLSRLSSEENTVEVRGTASSPSQLLAFQGTLSSAWGGTARIQRRLNGQTGLWEFTLQWTREGEHKK